MSWGMSWVVLDRRVTRDRHARGGGCTVPYDPVIASHSPQKSIRRWYHDRERIRPVPMDGEPCRHTSQVLRTSSSARVPAKDLIEKEDAWRRASGYGERK